MTEIKEKYRIGIVSDTHGLLRPEAVSVLSGVDRIIHAGDMDTPEVLQALQEIAPVSAVRGNMDRGRWCRSLKKTEVVEIDGHLIYVLHDIHNLDLDPAAAGFRMVIFGHSHRHAFEQQNGVIYLNPGGAGYHRFNYPISIAILEIEGDRMDPRIIELNV